MNGQPTMTLLNHKNNPEAFGGTLEKEANECGMEIWRFGDKFAARWHGESWNSGSIPWEDQIPIQ